MNAHRSALFPLLFLWMVVPMAIAQSLPPRVSPEIAVSPALRSIARPARGALFAGGAGTGLLAWSETRSGRSVFLATRVNREGIPVEPEPIAMEGGSGLSSIARGSDRYLVVGHGSEGIQGRFLSAGHGAPGEAFVIARPFFTGAGPEAVRLGDRFLVLWSEVDSLMGAFVSDSGAVLETLRLGDARVSLAAAAAPDGGAVLLSASRIESEGLRRRTVLRGPRGPETRSYTIEAAPVSGNGELGESIVLASDIVLGNNLAIARADGSYLAAWGTAEGYVWAVETDRFGRPADAAIQVGTGGSIPKVSVASGDGASVIAWSSSAVVWEAGGPTESFSLESEVLAAGAVDGSLLLFTSRFSEPLRSRRVLGTQLGSPVDLSVTAARQSNASIAAGLSEVFVVWVEEVDLLAYRVVGRRFSFAGVPLDSGPISLSNVERFEPVDVEAVSSGDEYLVLWTGAYSLDHIAGRRMSPAGVVLDDEPVVICRECTTDGEISAIRAGDRYAIAARGGELRGPVVYTFGSFPAADPEILTALDERIVDPVLAWSGRTLLASWVRVIPGPPCETPRCYPFPTLEIRAARIGNDGDPVEAEPLLLPGKGSPIAEGNLGAAAGSGAFAVVSKLDSPSPGVYAPGFNFTRIDEAGDLLGTDRIETESSVKRPQVVWTGRTFVVAYEDTYHGDIVGHGLLASGTPLGPFPIAATGAEERNPAAAAGPFGLSFVAYESVSRLAGAEYLPRVFFRRIVD